MIFLRKYYDEYKDVINKSVCIIFNENIILTKLFSEILLFKDTNINTIEFLKSCIPLFSKSLEIIKKYYNEIHHGNYLYIDYEVIIIDDIITDYKIIFKFDKKQVHIEHIIDFLELKLNNIYNKQYNIYEYLDSNIMDFELKDSIKKLLNYNQINIININDFGCNCNFIYYDDTKLYIKNNKNYYDIISYVLFAIKDNHNELLLNFKEFTDGNALDLINNNNINKYTKGLLYLGLKSEIVYDSWVVRLYYDDSLLYENNKKLYEPILRWLNIKKNIQLIKFNFDDYKDKKLFGALIRIFPLFDPTVSTVAFRDIDSIPLINDVKTLNDFRKSNKLIHVYKFKVKDQSIHGSSYYNPDWISCPLNKLNNKYNLSYKSEYNFPLGLTAINNRGLFDKTNSKELFDIINKEEKYIKEINKQEDIIKNNKIDDLIKYDYINKNIPIAKCLKSTKPNYSFWEFGTDEALFNLLLYKQIKMSELTVSTTFMYNWTDDKIMTILRDKIDEIGVSEYILEDFMFKPTNKKIFDYLFDKTFDIIIDEKLVNKYQVFKEEMMPFDDN